MKQRQKYQPSTAKVYYVAAKEISRDTLNAVNHHVVTPYLRWLAGWNAIPTGVRFFPTVKVESEFPVITGYDIRQLAFSLGSLIPTIAAYSYGAHKYGDKVLLIPAATNAASLAFEISRLGVKGFKNKAESVRAKLMKNQSLDQIVN